MRRRQYLMTACIHQNPRRRKYGGRWELRTCSGEKNEGRGRRQYGDRCGRSRCRRAQRGGCAPAANPNARNGETTQGKPLKNALIRRHKKRGALKREGKAWLGRNETRQSIF